MLRHVSATLSRSYSSQIKKLSGTIIEQKPSKSPSKKIRLLEPHILSARIQKFCGEGKGDRAVWALKEAPLDAQNTPVWNTLIWECLKLSRYKLAYELFTDVSKKICSFVISEVSIPDETSWVQP